MRLLNKFDYLSTVSGGGFIGGWLQMLIEEAGDVEKAQEKLATNRDLALHRLRGVTNYLPPPTGAFSADVWAGIVLYLRNLTLNWLVFGIVAGPGRVKALLLCLSHAKTVLLVRAQHPSVTSRYPEARGNRAWQKPAFP